jgi:hypothetical protein
MVVVLIGNFPVDRQCDSASSPVWAIDRIDVHPVQIGSGSESFAVATRGCALIHFDVDVFVLEVLRRRARAA